MKRNTAKRSPLTDEQIRTILRELIDRVRAIETRMWPLKAHDLDALASRVADLEERAE